MFYKVKVLVAIFFTVFVVVGIYFAYKVVSLNTSKCNKFAFVPGNEYPDCGFVMEFADRHTVYFVGRIVSLDEEGIEVFLGNKSIFPITQRFKYTSSIRYDIPFSDIPNEDYQGSDPSTWESGILTSKDVMTRLKKDDEIYFNVNTNTATPSIENFFTEKDLECNNSDKDYMTYLKNPGFTSYLKIMKWKYVDKCLPSINQFYY